MEVTVIEEINQLLVRKWKKLREEMKLRLLLRLMPSTVINRAGDCRAY